MSIAEKFSLIRYGIMSASRYNYTEKFFGGIRQVDTGSNNDTQAEA